MLKNSFYKHLNRSFSKSTKQLNFAVLLSGCGVYDGSEITESVAILMSISRHNAKYQCFSLNEDQHHVINHTNGQEIQQK
jgi:enhancing lycopene biosynthesis protein 2